MDVRLAVARWLEEGVARGPLAELASRAWATAAPAYLKRPLRWPTGASVVAIGGATLGGSGKTPLALACVVAMARGGVRVALVGHAYRASPRCARVVTPDDAVRTVGDEALACARALAAKGVRDARVVVAPSRQEALDLALKDSDVAVLDGALQTQPERASLSLLALDANDPWGAGSCPPRGDLRAPIPALLEACDAVVAIGHGGRGPLPSSEGLAGAARPVRYARVFANGAHVGRNALTWADLRSRRVGLWTAVARPSRIVDALEARGVEPRVTVSRPDHARKMPSVSVATRAAQQARLDLWLTTAKCRTGLGATLAGLPIAVLEYELCLDRTLVRALFSAVG